MTLSNNIIIILAGGDGKRMNSVMPKVLNNVGEKPMIVNIIEKSLMTNPDKIFVVLGKKYDTTTEVLMNYPLFYNETIEFVYQKNQIGTADAVHCCLKKLEYYHSHYIVTILPGDMPFIEMETIENMSKDFVLISRILTTKLDDPKGYNRIIEKNGYFDKIKKEDECNEIEKQIKKVDCGIYSFNCVVLLRYLPMLFDNISEKEYELSDIFKIIKRNEPGYNCIDTIEIPVKKQYQLIDVNTKQDIDNATTTYEKLTKKQKKYNCILM